MTESKVIHLQIPVPKWKKRKSGKKYFGLQNGAISGLQIGARGITNRGSFGDFISGQTDYNSGQKEINSGQGLQIGAEQSRV